ncbi:MAG TPA: hypothetical protein VHC39_07950 [Rhizomicrobium sp.]|nr:hypothetical protein [Rhizomicrobium sp.]
MDRPAFRRFVARNRATVAVMFLAGLMTAPAWAADYSKSEKTALYQTSLKVPAAASAIPPLQAEILRRFQLQAKTVKDDALDDKKAAPENFHPYMLDTQWRVTFESARIISLSGLSFVDENGAHPNDSFDTIVWDKTAKRAVKLPELFVKEKLPAALRGIAEYAKTALRKKFPREEGQPADYDPVEGNIAADPEKLGQYALTYARGETRANGIVLLWGAGEAWPHVMGDIRISIPVSVFGSDLAPQWAAEFK